MIQTLKDGDYITMDLFGRKKSVEVVSVGDNQFDENGDYKERGFTLSA